MAPLRPVDELAAAFKPFPRLGELVDDAEFEHLFGGVGLVRDDQPVCHRAAELAGEDRMRAHSGEQPEQHFGQSEGRPAFGDDIVE